MSLKTYLIVYKNGTHEFMPADWASIREGDSKFCFGNGGYGTQAPALPFAWVDEAEVSLLREVTGWDATQVEFILSRLRTQRDVVEAPSKAPEPVMDGIGKVDAT